MATKTFGSTKFPTRQSRNPRMRSSGSRRPRSAARISISTGARSSRWRRATSSATSRWASSRRWAPTSTACGPATASSCRSTSPAARASTATSSSSRSARRRPATSTARARTSSATPISTAACPAARPSTCGCRRRSSGRSRCPRGPTTRGSCSSPTYCPPRGRRSSTPTARRAARWRSTAWARSGRCACRSACTAAQVA